MRTLVRLAILLAFSGLTIGACDTTSPSPNGSTRPASQPAGSASAFQPTFATVGCPDDVASQIVIPLTCGYLTVLEDRSKPAGRTIQLFVARLDPPGGTTTPDPVITVGHLGIQDGYGDMSGAGQRTHRVLYLVDSRGIGHSTPSLACPEVGLIAADLVGLRRSDPARQAKLVGAVTACHDRLVGQGIDLSMYGTGADTADYVDLRRALGIPSWNIITYGSPVAFELASSDAAATRSVVIDSPGLPSPNFLTTSPSSLDRAISRVVTACAGDAGCARAYPDAAAMIRSAVTGLDAAPQAFDVTGTVDAIRLGHPVHVVVDGAALVRVIRVGLGSSGGANIGRTLALVQRVIDRTLTSADSLVVQLSSDVGDCLGLLANCEGPSFGVVYSVVCQDIAPSIDASRLAADVDGRPAYAEAFSPSPLLDACPAWAVEPALLTRPSSGLTGGAPTLVLRGEFDPYSAALSDVQAASEGTPNVFTLEIPNQSYNVLGYTECPRTIRTAWIDHPTAAPADTSCLAGIPALQLAP